MYWTDDSNNRIYSANLDGTNSTILISTGLNCPRRFELEIIYPNSYYF